nr:multiple epidermal growth factor-like domains protein 10 isoform X2 [Crassostrea gigas]
MKTSVVILALSFLEFYHCYENLCRKNSTTVLQSSTFVNHKAALAVDGDIRTTDRYCSHTDVNQTVAWFQVDLGKPYSINNVTLYYRKDGLGDKDWQPYRFRQFYLDVSDLPASQKTTAHRTRCYTANTTHPDVLPHIIDIPCKHTARYVIVETTYDAPEDDPVAGAMLEICEIEVSGCETGQYGDDCLPCQRCETCEINSGMCDCLATCINQTCNDTNGHCTFGCATGNWDPKCGSVCPANCQDRKCFRENGLCETCKQGYWGNYCNQTCSTFCNEHICSKSDGRCNKGCNMGRYGDFCDKVCSPGCVKGSCDSQSGACSNRCYQNWMGTRCDRCDSTHYGLNCTRRCSVNCTIGCTKDTGVCYSCVEGKFGEYCDKKCGIGCVSGCDQYSGQCVCKLGWQSDRCEDCSPFHYGVDCNKKCSSSCLYGTCYTINGTCKGGCKCSVVEELSQQGESDVKFVRIQHKKIQQVSR